MPPDVRRVVFLLPVNDWTGGCIVNIDYELSKVLEFISDLKTDDLTEFLKALEDFGQTDYSDFQEIHLSHNWFHTEVLSAINGSASGLLEGELLDEAEILLGEGRDSKATSSALMSLDFCGNGNTNSEWDWAINVVVMPGLGDNKLAGRKGCIVLVQSPEVCVVAIASGYNA